jgi:very-short-patch-repair endonuclease
MSLPEVLLWQRIRGRGFRRQHPIGPFILDFYCSRIRLAIEVDGLQHDARTDQDARRDTRLQQFGIRTLRIPASDVLRDPDAAAEHILGQLDEH